MVKKKTGSPASSSELKNIYLFYGEDNFRAYEKLSHWREQFKTKYGDFNIHSFYAEDLTASKFQSAIESYPFLAEKKLIVIYDFLNSASEDNLKNVAALLEFVAEHNVVVFYEHHKPDARKTFFKTMQKIGKLEEFALLNQPQLVKWIQDRFSKANLQVQLSLCQNLAEMVGPNLWTMENEIKKLILFSIDKEISLSIIEQVVSSNLSSNIFKLTDALGVKKIDEVFKILKILIDNDEPLMGILFALVSHFRVMIQVKFLLEQGLNPLKISQKLKKHSFLINKLSAQAKKFSFAEIQFIYTQFSKIDIALKTGKIRITTNDLSDLERAIEVSLIQFV